MGDDVPLAGWYRVLNQTKRNTLGRARRGRSVTRVKTRDGGGGRWGERGEKG